jgi:PAS domain S-box-containing protein
VAWPCDLIAGRRAALAAIVAAFCLTLPPGVAAAAEPASVLLLYSDPRLLPAIVTVDQALRATIEERSSAPVRFFSEYLDLSWFNRAQQDHASHTMLLKYAGVKFDLVVPCGEPALRFALEQRQTLFGGAPIVFCTVEDAAVDAMRLPLDVTGVTVFRDWASSVDLILKLHPDTRRIVFVGGAGPVEREWERLAREAFSRYEGRLTFTHLSALPMRQIVEAVGGFAAGTVILFNVFLLDEAGHTFSSPEALALLAPAAKVPIYGSAETQLGRGIVGGHLVSYEAQARRAGELAARVLAGERLGPADIARRIPSRYMFDARQLGRWGIQERLLPPASIVKFRVPSLWSQYRLQALGTLAFVAVQSLLIVGLLIQRQRRRHVQQRLDERLRFEVLLSDLATAFIAVPAREIYLRTSDGLRRVVEELRLDRAGLATFTADGDQLRTTHTGTRDGVPAPPAVLTSEAWPSTLRRLRDGVAVSIARLDDLPAEATIDRQSFLALATKSIVIVPVFGGGAVVGAVWCSMLRHEREWPDELVQRLRLLADIFAVVLMRQRADQAILESESRFQTMADAAPVMMWIAGPDGRCTDFNRTWLAFTGRSLAAELGDGWVEGVHADDRDACMASYRAALEARRSFSIEYRLRRADGVYRTVLDTGVPRFDTDQTFTGFMGSATDITDVKAAQQSLLENLALRSAILGSLYGEVVALDRAGVIIAVNESWMRAMEEHRIDARAAGVGVNYLQVCRRGAAHGDDDARAALDAMESVLAGRTTRAELEYPCPGPDGVRWFTMIVEPLRRPEGGLVISHLDVTRRQRAEEAVQRDREDLAHALRVATLGELATSLAHEINQPLAAIASNAQAARRLLGSAAVDPELPDVLRDITADAQRAGQIIRQLRVLFRKEHREQQPVDLTAVIKEVLALLRADLERRRVRLEVALMPGAPRVLGDVVQLQQVVLNVVINAAEAMAKEAEPRDLRIEMAVRESDIITITVSDSGKGVEASELEHIFERFVTSKPEGLGMGLPISRSIVEAHGGRLWATRNPGRGLTLHLELPCLER